MCPDRFKDAVHMVRHEPPQQDRSSLCAHLEAHVFCRLQCCREHCRERVLVRKDCDRVPPRL
eukprot:10975590-Lingulodinium_polyedra.AAC.1